MSPSIEIVGDTQIIAKLEALPATLQAKINARVTSLAEQMKSAIKLKLSGQVLKVRTGNLRDSIDYSVASAPTEVSATIFSDNSVKYGRIHEYGGTINHPGGTAYFIGGDKLAHFLSNRAAESRDGFKRTKPHQIKMPARPFMRPTLAEFRTEIEDGMRAAVSESVDQ